jgi:hypothetical protein
MTTDEARAALREKVFSITKVCAEPCKPDANDCPCRVDADAAIAVVLEEAARVASDDGHSHGCNCEYCYGHEHAAAAIRGLIGKTK